MSMYEARQNKEKVNRTIGSSIGVKQYNFNNYSIRNTIQMLKDTCLNQNGMVGMSDDEYKRRCRSTVFLFAELVYNGTNLYPGMFTNTSKKHAEENLLEYLQEQNVTEGTLNIKLSTSCCSSTFGTTKEPERVGCLEQLEAYNRNNPNLTINIESDHLYQPQHVQNSKDCSEAAVLSSDLNIGISNDVAQF